jgi:hypothetical protein
MLCIAADGLRLELGYCGEPLARSWNVDRLAAEGVLFEA